MNKVITRPKEICKNCNHIQRFHTEGICSQPTCECKKFISSGLIYTNEVLNAFQQGYETGFSQGINKMTKEHKEIITNKELLEQLADLEHQQWAHWTKYMIDTLYTLFDIDTIHREDCSAVIALRRWQKQIKTDYKALSEKEKESDREWARKVIEKIENQNNEGVKEQ